MNKKKEEKGVFQEIPLVNPGDCADKLQPPIRSKGLFSDIKYFLLNKPETPTLIHFNSIQEKEDFSYRITQRLGVGVSDYKILNIHRIGIDVPAKYVFEELLNWNGDSSCWPNYIAKVERSDNSLEHIAIYLFGWINLPKWFKNSMIGRSFIPLFKMDSLVFKKIPDATSSDNARFLLYRTSGGYPIGLFSMYVRSSIENQNELSQTQLFMMVGFNFYGAEKWSERKIINRFWEAIHDRVTSNVLCRFKHFCEWRFEKIKLG